MKQNIAFNYVFCDTDNTQSFYSFLFCVSKALYSEVWHSVSTLQQSFSRDWCPVAEQLYLPLSLLKLFVNYGFG